MGKNVMKHMALTHYAMPKGATPDRLDPRARSVSRAMVDKVN